MTRIMSSEEFRAEFGGGAPANKYGVSAKTEREWRGRVYDSKMEMRYARDVLAKDPTVLEVVEQPRLWLGVVENVYVPDFLVIRQGSAWYVDVKGTETAQFVKVKKLWARYARLSLHVVKWNRGAGAFETVEIVNAPGQAS